MASENFHCCRNCTRLLTVIFLFITIDCWSQEELNSKPQKLPREAPTIRFEHLGLEDGLQQGSVHDIMQDSQGYLWLTTQDGLHRYDGYEFKSYSSTPFDSGSLSSNWVWQVEEAANGDLWVTTNENGLERMDRTAGTFTHYKHDPKDSTTLSTNSVFDVVESENGDLWVSTFGGGLNYMPAGEDGKFQHFRHDPSDSNSLTSDQLFLITEDSQGNIWVGSDKGLNKIDSKTKKITRYLNGLKNESGSEYSIPVSNIYQYPQEEDVLWLATGGGLVRLDSKTGEFERFVLDKNDNKKNDLYQVVPDPSEPHILWVAGPSTGVARFNMTTGEFTSYRNDPRNQHSLGEDMTFSLFADRSGTMWAGHYIEGLSKFNPGSINFYHLQHDPEEEKSLAFGPVWGLYEDHQQILWVGTHTPVRGAFLTRIDPDGKITRYKGEVPDMESLSPGSITSFAEDSRGQFWIGGVGGLNLMDRKTGKIKRYTHFPFSENAQRNNIRSLIPAKHDKNLLWIGTTAGLESFNTIKEQFELYRLPTKEPEDQPSIQSLLQSDDHTLWIGTRKGLYKIDKKGHSSLASSYDPNDTTTISSNRIFSLLERKKEPGILWIGTDGGLNRFDTSTGKARHYLDTDGLPNNIIYGILEDSNGTLWMSTNRGISNFDPDKESFRNYGLDDGLIALEYDQFAYAKGEDGMMYFGSMEGVTAFMPEKLSINETPPEVVLAGLKLFNKPIGPGPNSVLKKPLSETQQLTLEYDQKEITFDFVGLHYGNPARNSYAYKLEGFEDEWVEAGSKRSATYTNLSPGNYIFKVKAANADGVWSKEEASLDLTILPPWYQTWWAYVLFVIVLIALVVGVDRFQRHRLKKQEQERAILREAELRAEAENKRRADTEQLSKIGRAITSTLSITTIIETVYENVNELMDAAIFGIGIYNAKTNKLEFPATKEKGQMLPPYDHEINDENRLAVWCFNNSKEIIIGDTSRESSKYVKKSLPPIKGDDSKSLIYLPLVHQDRTIGVITTQSFNENAYTTYHVHLLRNLATYAAIALDNASAYRKLDATIKDLQIMQEQLIQQEKLASLGQLTAGIAHEIKNPLNFVNNFSDLSVELIDEAREELKEVQNRNRNDIPRLEEVSRLLEDVKTNLLKICKHGTRADGIVKSMLQHSRGGSGKKEPTNLNDLIREYVNLSFHGMRASKHPIDVELDLQLDEKVGKVSLIEEDFSRVVVNLCTNSFEAMREKSLRPHLEEEYRPKLTVRSLKEQNKVILEFEDNGPGIPEDLKDKILQPFFTTKRGTAGTGLGLSITHDIIQSHGGNLSLESSRDTGTCFIIELPVGSRIGVPAE